MCLPARPRVVSPSLAWRLVVRGVCRVARELALIAVLRRVAPRWYRTVRECLLLVVARGLEAASMVTRCVALHGESVVLPARVCAGLVWR